MKAKTNDKRDQQSDNKSNQSTKQEAVKKEAIPKNVSTNSEKKSTQSGSSKRK